MVNGIGWDVHFFPLVYGMRLPPYLSVVGLGAHSKQDGDSWVHPDGLVDHHVQILEAVHLCKVKPLPNFLTLV